MAPESRLGCLFLGVLTVCACNRVITLGVLDAGADAPDADVARERDDCGNGVDDDADERIDEGCFCAPAETQPCFVGDLPTREVGVCSDGVQSCQFEGTEEWGTWGDCEDAEGPRAQGCDGVDADCDGAVDEGCPCTAGEQRGCETTPGLSASCQPGIQRCLTDGRWSGCEGGTLPTAERCGDGIDNDCDGAVDEPSLCACEPEPERCGDGVDNDCDGSVDEPDACTLCEPATEVCGDDEDQDCDGRVDEGCAGCDPAIDPPRPVAPMSTSFVTSHRPTLAWNPSGPGHLRLCADRACTVEVVRADVDGDRFRPAEPLEPGVYFWNVATKAEETLGCPSPTWELVVRRRDTPVDGRFGSLLDVDGDGRADVVVSAKSAEVPPGSGSGAGRLFVYRGGRTGLPAGPPTVVESPWAPVERLEGFGSDFESAGDVNGDGFGDLIVSAPFVENLGTESEPQRRGRAWVYHGGPAGLATEPAAELVIPSSHMEDQSFGASLAGLGDVNGDGYGDVAVASALEVRVYLGSASGTDGSAAVTLSVPTSGFPNAPLVSSGCDTNGDGFADLIVGDAGAEDFQGRIYLWEGGPGGLSGAPDRTLHPAHADGPGLGFAISCAGDVNGDGFSDIIGGAPGVRTAVPGRVYVFHGSATGVAVLPSSTTTLPDETEDLGSMVGGVGDLNGDGFDDLLVAFRASPLASRLFVTFGSGGGAGTSTAAELEASGVTGFGTTPPRVVDLDGDGSSDVLVPASGMVLYFSGPPEAGSWSASDSLLPPSGLGSTDGFGSVVGGLGAR